MPLNHGERSKLGSVERAMRIESLTSLWLEVWINRGKDRCNLRNHPTTGIETMPKSIDNAGVEREKCGCHCGNQRRPPVQIGKEGEDGRPIRVDSRTLAYKRTAAALSSAERCRSAKYPCADSNTGAKVPKLLGMRGDSASGQTAQAQRPGPRAAGHAIPTQWERCAEGHRPSRFPL